jgi:hypothetical protein
MGIKSSSTIERGSIHNGISSSGFVRWTLSDEKTGKYIGGGRSNILVNYTRETLASAMIGTSVTYPGTVAVGTGTTAPAAADTGLETLSQYDGANNAKAVDSKSIKSIYTSRFVVQFSTSEANITIRELGLFDDTSATNMWARVSVNITKTSSQRLTVYWYITFDRSSNVAIKTGGSIAATGTAAAATAFTLTFASAVTVLMINNNAGEELYFRFNQALDAGNPPVSYDIKLDDNETFQLLNEEISITTVSVFGATISGALPLNGLSVVGW